MQVNQETIEKLKTFPEDQPVFMLNYLNYKEKVIENKTDNKLLLLKTEMNAGHGGKSGRDGAIEEIAIDYAFALKISEKI